MPNALTLAARPLERYAPFPHGNFVHAGGKSRIVAAQQK